MTIKTEKKPAKTLLESTPIDEVLYQKMKEIYSEYTGLQISAVIAKIRQEINANEELLKRKEMLAKLGISG